MCASASFQAHSRLVCKRSRHAGACGNSVSGVACTILGYQSITCTCDHSNRKGCLDVVSRPVIWLHTFNSQKHIHSSNKRVCEMQSLYISLSMAVSLLCQLTQNKPPVRHCSQHVTQHVSEQSLFALRSPSTFKIPDHRRLSPVQDGMRWVRVSVPAT